MAKRGGCLRDRAKVDVWDGAGAGGQGWAWAVRAGVARGALSIGLHLVWLA